MNTLNDIKKVLYKENPKAVFLYYRKDVLYYNTSSSIGIIDFSIPIEDTGDANFSNTMDSKLLIRWIVDKL